MTEPIYACEDHGFYEGTDCPICGSSGTSLLSGGRRRTLSKYLSGALRHYPDNAGLELDGRGWTDDDDLVAAACRRYAWVRPEHVEAVIATDPKGRFEWTGADDGGTERVRAAYGHSVDVDLEPTDAPVPDDLYHGTASDNLESILEEGLRPMARQRVHLSHSPAAARRVGRRHTDDPVLLVVDAAAMLADGRRIAKRGRETYTTEWVPPAYLAVADERSETDPDP